MGRRKLEDRRSHTRDGKGRTHGEGRIEILDITKRDLKAERK